VTTARLFTSSWTSLWRASQRDSLPVQPVRISRGTPKFWPAAKAFPAVDELMPGGWMLSKSTDAAKAERGYRHKLHRIGLERIGARLDAIADECGLPLAIACFEPDPADCHRSWAAAWLREQTGLTVPEIGSLTAARVEPGQERQQVLVYEVDGQPVQKSNTHFCPAPPDAITQLSLDGEARR
jgi:hypothetical protein